MDVIDELQKCLTALAQQLDAAKHQQRQEGGDASTSISADESSEDGPNPLIVLGRLEKLQHDTLPNLRNRCERVVALKRELVTATRETILPARKLLIPLQMTAGVPILSAKGSFTDLVDVLNAWDHVGESPRRNQRPTGSSARASSHQPPRKRMRDNTDGGEDGPERQLEMIVAAEGCGASASEAATAAALRLFQMNKEYQRRSSERFVPIDEEEFSGVSTVVRGRCKLEDVNTVYEQLYQLKQQQVVRKWPATVAELAAKGLKVGGISGEQKLGTLRSLGIITMTKQGVAFVEDDQKDDPR